jgi:hypothetical protein
MQFETSQWHIMSTCSAYLSCFAHCTRLFTSIKKAEFSLPLKDVTIGFENMPYIVIENLVMKFCIITC